MRRWLARLSLAMLGLVMLAGLVQAQSTSGSCTGKFPNPVTDICWRCMLPLSLGGAKIANIGGQSDIANPGSPVCSCGGGIPPKVGVTLGFWEPAILAEVPRQPFCFPSLGGVRMNTGGFQPAQHGRMRPNIEHQISQSFYHAHHYTFPALYVLGVVNDHPCLTKSSIDIGYITEFDPTWNVPTLSSWFNPEAFLFANPLALAACAADCVAATVDKPLAATPWCAGCQGSLHPMQGHVPHHTGGVATSLLLTQRLQAKMHKVGVAWQYHGGDALCGPHPNLVMDRQAYKTQMLYPVPNTMKRAQPASTGANTLPTPGTSTGVGNTPIPVPAQAYQGNSRCCQNFGETSIVWGSGKEFPIKGEDFAYLLFRKRNCCMILNK